MPRQNGQPSLPTARCPKCQLVLCGCARGERPAPFGEKPTDIPVDQIFEGITLDSINAWRDLEQAERERLAGELQDKQRREAEQTAYEISKITPSFRLIGRR